MKQLSILVLLILSRCGTDQGERDEYNYTVKNESGVPITIKSYRSKLPSGGTPIITYLETNKSINKVYEDGLPPRGYNFKVFLGNGDRFRDSLVVIYNEEKMTTFKDGCNENISNPLNSCKYNSLNETFIFTKEDYENATDCGGDCE